MGIVSTIEKKKKYNRRMIQECQNKGVGGNFKQAIREGLMEKLISAKRLEANELALQMFEGCTFQAEVMVRA